MRNLRRMISAILVLCMVLSVMPPVFAEAAGEGRILLNDAAFAEYETVWVDGVEYPVQGSGSGRYVDLPAEAPAGSMTAYSYYVGDPEDVHTQYPVGMKVWELHKNEDGSYTPAEVEELENILQYSGSSIRITGTKGIRMITSIEQSKKSSLVSGDLAGYTLQEYGTVISWSSDLEGGKPLILGEEYAKSNYAYKRGKADPIFKHEGSLMQYTNVLVGFELDQCAGDIAMRSYMILENEAGEQITVYGGIVHRSIGYIAWQNRHVFTKGTSSYNYVWEIIRAVYGDISEIVFQTNGGSVMEPVVVDNGVPMEQPADPVREGFTFAGWYTDPALTKAYDFSQNVQECMVLYAKWKEYQEPSSDTVSLVISEDEFIIGDEGWVYFYAEATCDIYSMLLIDAETGEVILELRDDGLYEESGDDLPNDQVFSGRMWVDTYSEQTYSYCAVANEMLISDPVSVSVISTFSEEQIEQMEEADQSIQDDIFSAPGYDDMDQEARADLAYDALQDMADGGLIDVNSIYYDEETAIYTFMYESGALGAVILDETYGEVNGIAEEEPAEETEAAEIPAEETLPAAEEEAEEAEEETLPAPEEEPVEETTAPTVPEEIPEETEAVIPEEETEGETEEEEGQKDFTRVETDTYHASGAEESTVNAADTTVSVGDALILWSFDQKWDDPDYRVPFYYSLEEEWEENGLNTVINWAPTVEDYKNLEGYEVIVFSGHGAYNTYKFKEGLFGEKYTLTVPSLLLHEKATGKKDEAYTSDLKNFRIGKIHVKGGKMYAILPNFFETYYDSDDLNGSFIFAENCEFRGCYGNVNYEMANVLAGASAEAVVGFHNSVMADYSRELMRTYVNVLISGETAGDAFEYAKLLHGSDDYFVGRHKYGPTAYPIFSGNPEARLIDSSLKNGSFEDAGSPVYWDNVGDTRILKRLGDLMPQHGGAMAIITTGIGSAEDDYLSGTEGSVLSQTFVVPEYCTTLNLHYDVVSEEPMEYVGTSFNDTFIVRLIHQDGTTEILREEINTAVWHEIYGINFDGGDDTMYHTMWKSANVDLSAYVGQVVTIQFVVFDMGDSIYDTAVLIDDVCLK